MGDIDVEAQETVAVPVTWNDAAFHRRARTRDGSLRHQRRSAVNGKPWPEPHLQPDPRRDCSYYANAYVARCLGFPDVTTEQIKKWREENNRSEDWFIRVSLGVVPVTYNDYMRDEDCRRKFWLGPDNRPFVEHWLAEHIAKASIHRIQQMSHAVVALEARSDGVLIMDPIYSFRVEPWEWFLGVGAGTHGCHRFDAIYPLRPAVLSDTRQEQAQ